MNDSPQPVDAGTVKFLRVLVTVLTATMIVGLLVVIGLLVTMFSDLKTPALPDTITLPSGAKATAFTQGGRWYAVVTADDRILIFNRTTGQLMQTVEIAPEG